MAFRAQHGVCTRKCIVTMRSRDPVSNPSTPYLCLEPPLVVDLAGANRYELLLKVEEPGHYVDCVKYEGQTIGPPCRAGATNF